MTPDDFQEMNDILIAQSGDMEILIQGQAERIRDLEAEVERLKGLLPYSPNCKYHGDESDPKPLYLHRDR